MELFSFILACYGCTMIAVYGKIFDAIRPQYHFFKCPMCMGWWVGAAMSLHDINTIYQHLVFAS